MKRFPKLIAILLLLSLFLSACSPALSTEETSATTEEASTEVKTEAAAPSPPPAASEAEINALLALYAGKTAYHGEMHDHSDSGGSSDGHNPLSEWKENLAALNMDFAAIVDHRQVLHMYHEDWDNSIFIGGTEAATTIDSKYSFHYNMIFSDPKDLEALLSEFPEFKFTGELDCRFSYPRFSTTRFRELIDAVKAHNGMFTIVHPRQSEALIPAINFWYRDYTGLEVFYVHMNDVRSKLNYKLWVELLSMGKRIWATAGTDKHRLPATNALTTVYASEKNADSYLDPISQGNFTCGSVGIRMAVGDTVMGSSTSFTGKKLIVTVDDFHESVIKANHQYRMDLIDETGIVYSTPVTPGEPLSVSVDAGNSRFWRVEIIDESAMNMRIALGNPIWNDDPVVR